MKYSKKKPENTIENFISTQLQIIKGSLFILFNTLSGFLFNTCENVLKAETNEG